MTTPTIPPKRRRKRLRRQSKRAVNLRRTPQRKRCPQKVMMMTAAASKRVAITRRSRRRRRAGAMKARKRRAATEPAPGGSTDDCRSVLNSMVRFYFTSLYFLLKLPSSLKFSLRGVIEESERKWSVSCGQRGPNSATAVNGLLMGIFAAAEEVLLSLLQCRLRFSYLSEADAFLSANCRFPATVCALCSLPSRLFSRKISSVMRVCSCSVPLLLLLLKADCVLSFASTISAAVLCDCVSQSRCLCLSLTVSVSVPV